MSTVSVQRVIAASPEALYALVSDLPRMGEWSPENTGGTWKGPAGSVGSKFSGTNANGSKTWSTTCTISEAAIGKAFAFDVSVAGLKVATWRYDFEPVGGGTKVSETWTDRRNAVARFFAKFATGVADRAEHNRQGMEATLAALATAIGE